MEKFSLEENGYNKKEVNDFVLNVIKETEGIVKVCEEQVREIKYLRDELSKSNNNSNYHAFINNAIEEKEIITKMALSEAEGIIADAKDTASHIINDALIKVEDANNKKELIDANIKLLKKRLKMILEEQKNLLELIEEINTDK